MRAKALEKVRETRKRMVGDDFSEEHEKRRKQQRDLEQRP